MELMDGEAGEGDGGRKKEERAVTMCCLSSCGTAVEELWGGGRSVVVGIGSIQVR